VAARRLLIARRSSQALGARESSLACDSMNPVRSVIRQPSRNIAWQLSGELSSQMGPPWIPRHAQRSQVTSGSGPTVRGGAHPLELGGRAGPRWRREAISESELSPLSSTRLPSRR
jgi:hypothetical protein